MKKSEMKQHLKSILRARQDLFADYAEGNISLGVVFNEIIGTISIEIEQKGMLPPLFNKFQSENSLNLVEAVLDQSMEDFKWDDE